MKKKWRVIFLLSTLFSISALTYGQISAQYPPEPILAAQDTTTGPCGQGDGGNPGGISPPVGLCLPINDYIFPLFISGIGLGVFSLYNFKERAKSLNS